MDPKLFDETMRAFYDRMPFEPFEIELTDGKTLRVESPRKLCFRDGHATLSGPGKYKWTFFNHTQISPEFAEKWTKQAFENV